MDARGWRPWGRLRALVMMGLQMPEMDGLEARAAMRPREAREQTHTPIVAMTASAVEGDHERYLAAGMDDYISKPVRLQALERPCCGLAAA